MFVARSADPQAFVVGVLVTQWDWFHQIYAFQLLQLLPRHLRIIKMKDILVVHIALNYPEGCSTQKCADSWWALPNWPDLLSQGPIPHPAFQVLALTAWLLKSRSWWTGANCIQWSLLFWRLGGSWLLTKSITVPGRPILNSAKQGNLSKEIHILFFLQSFIYQHLALSTIKWQISAMAILF